MTISFIVGWYLRLTPICFMKTSAEVLVSKANSESILYLEHLWNNF